jgi:hypothetical protein
MAKRTKVKAEETAVDQVADAAETTEAPAPKEKSKVQIDRTKYSYVQHDSKTKSGRKSIDNNDLVAGLLRGLTIEEVQGVVNENGLEWKWGHLNAGMQRMNAGNALRGLMKKHGKVLVVGKVYFATEDQEAA